MLSNPRFSAMVFSYVTILVFLPSVLTLSIDKNARTSLSLPIHRRQEAPQGSIATEGVIYDKGFWFTNVTIGGSETPAELLVDTGSADLVLNSGRYQPSSNSVNLQTTFNVTYGTTSNGAGNSQQTITGDLFTDSAKFDSLTVSNQTIGVASGSSTSNSSSDGYPHDGIIGLGSQTFSSTNSTPYFQSLCDQKLVSECRFGLALEINGTGTLSLGGIDTAALPGGDSALTKVPIVEEWFVFADLALNGKILTRDLLVELDSGSSGIVGPIDAVSNLFNEVGIQGVRTTSAQGDVLTGYFPCSHPPSISQIGFSMPSASNISSNSAGLPNMSKSSTIFDIVLSAMSSSSQGNNCTASISGFDFAELPGLWVVGQAWFQGHYIDHNLEDASVGVAVLGASSSSSGSSSNASATSSGTRPSSTASSAAAGSTSSAAATGSGAVDAIPHPALFWALLPAMVLGLSLLA